MPKSDVNALDFEQRQDANDLEPRVVDDPEWAAREIVALRAALAQEREAFDNSTIEFTSHYEEIVGELRARLARAEEATDHGMYSICTRHAIYSPAKRAPCPVCALIRAEAERAEMRAGFDADLEDARAAHREVHARAESAEADRDRMREGLLYLGYAMRDGNCNRIRERWGGNTPEDWCAEADAMHNLLAERNRMRRERDAAVLDQGHQAVECGTLRAERTRLRAALTEANRQRDDAIVEVLLLIAVYCGFPASSQATIASP